MKYIYCIIDKTIKKNFGLIGIDDKKVYSIPFKDVSAIVQDFSPELKQNFLRKSKEKQLNAIIEHQYVIDRVMKEFTLIPFNIGTIIGGDEEKVKEFLNKRYQELKAILEKNKNKFQYGIQIFYESKDTKSSKNEELKEGVKAYILKQKEKREKLMTKLNYHRKNFYDQISKLVDEIKIEKSTKDLSKNEIINLSCLVKLNKVKELKQELRKINKPPFSVKFNGPWPPYSFV